MTRQVPMGAADLDCPQWRKPMSECCHKCPWWTKVSGMHPQTGEQMDKWDCAISLLPMLLVNVAREQTQGTAATNDFRNQVLQRAEMAAVGAQQQRRLS